VESSIDSALGLPARLSLDPAPALSLLVSVDVALGRKVLGVEVGGVEVGTIRGTSTILLTIDGLENSIYSALGLPARLSLNPTPSGLVGRLGGSNGFGFGLSLALDSHLFLPARLSLNGTPRHRLGDGIRLRISNGFRFGFGLTLGLGPARPALDACTPLPTIRLGISNGLRLRLSLSLQLHLLLPARLSLNGAPRHGLGNRIGLRSSHSFRLRLSLSLGLPARLALDPAPGIGHRLRHRVRNGDRKSGAGHGGQSEDGVLHGSSSTCCVVS